jgi:hypothetical protein
MRKTDLDLKRERVAHALNAGLVGTGLYVSSGGKEGPYQLTVRYLNERELRRLIRVFERIISGGQT